MIEGIQAVYPACLHLITGDKGYFCLKVKEWNEPCPPKCPWHVPVTNANNMEVNTNKYHIECQHCTRILATPDTAARPAVYCALLEMEDPRCEPCELRRWI